MLQKPLFSLCILNKNLHKINLFLFVSLSTLFSGCNGDITSNKAPKNVNSNSNQPSYMNTVTSETIPVAIIGGGVAGLTAAMYSANANVSSTVFEGPKPGGALAQSHSVRNWPGVIDAPGSKIVGDIKKQALEAGVIIKQEKVVSADFTTRPFVITTEELADASTRKTYKALTCVIAMGSEPNYLGIPGETGKDGYWGRGVGNCAVCEGSLYKNKNVAIVGGGDASIVEAGYLSDIVNNVTVYVRKDTFRAKDISARDRVLAKKNVKVVFETRVSEVMGDNNKVTHLHTENTKTGEKAKVDIDGLFLAIGSKPNTMLFEKQLELDADRFISLKNYQETSVPGVFAAGDICEKLWVQAIRASDQGYIAAMQAKKFLDSIGYDPIKIKENNNKPAKKEEQKEEIKHKVIELRSENDVTKYIHNNKSLVVIDFFATWCMPCQAMVPVLEKLAEHFGSKVTFVKINIQNSPVNLDALMARIKGEMFSAVPTFAFVKNGKYAGKVTGLREFAAFKRDIEARLNK